MIFSAGLGTRFKPWTDRHPKALAIVNGKSLLQRNIEYLQRYGIREVVVNVHHFSQQVMDAIQRNEGWGSKVLISDESEKVLETGGGLLNARDLFAQGEQFITCNVDILTDLNLDSMMEFHGRHQPLVTMAVTSRKTSRNFLFDHEGRLCGWMNNQSGERRISIERENLQQKAYSCVVCFQYGIFDLMPFRDKLSLVDVYLELARNHTILGFDHTGDKWVDVGRPESVQVAESLFP